MGVGEGTGYSRRDVSDEIMVTFFSCGLLFCWFVVLDELTGRRKRRGRGGGKERTCALISLYRVIMSRHRSALKTELALCAQFLEQDGRNFHCWAHRMWVAGVMGLSVEEDFNFTTAKIKQVQFWEYCWEC